MHNYVKMYDENNDNNNNKLKKKKSCVIINKYNSGFLKCITAKDKKKI